MFAFSSASVLRKHKNRFCRYRCSLRSPTQHSYNLAPTITPIQPQRLISADNKYTIFVWLQSLYAKCGLSGLSRTCIQPLPNSPQENAVMYGPLALKFLRISPLMSSTAGLMCAWDQQWTFSPFLHPSVPQGPAGDVLPHWFPVVFSKLIWVVSIVHPLGGLLGLLNGFGSPGGAIDGRTRMLYIAGGFFAAMHAVYGKTAMRMIGVIWDKNMPGDKNLAMMGPWLKMNWWRIMTMNVPAVGFFLAAVLRTVEVTQV